ncbi:MAG TPA: caspase family protein, partial [Xanthobacteraceae bacterium]
MRRLGKMMAALLAMMPIALALAAGSAHAEKRIALVIGNTGYQAGALNTPANDAGLIAQTLEAAGFDVAGARDLDQDSLRRAFRDFLEKATKAGPDTVAFIYVSGYGLQLEGENYLVPVDAKINRDADIAAEALRVSDYTRPLAALKLKGTIVVLDAARA